MDNTRRADLVLAAVNHAIACDFEEAMAAIAEIAQASTGRQMYGVCCALAETGRQILVRLYGQQHPETLWALAAPDPDNGPVHPAHAFSLRFLTAFVNRDLPTCEALYMAALRASGEDFAHSVTSLLGDVARLGRHALLEELLTPAEQITAHLN